MTITRTPKGVAEDKGADVNRRFSILNCLIFDSNVDGGMPSFAAAPSRSIEEVIDARICEENGDGRNADRRLAKRL